MSDGERIVLALLENGRAPDWSAAEQFAASFTFEQLEELLESPATLGFHEFGAGVERVREELRADLALLRDALAHGHDELARFETHGLIVYAAADDSQSNALFLAMDRLRWSGTLAAAGFDVPR